jgi:DAACS family dicarboxylate/amino acid:cation (Na+ or H+) symporter/aerobic C4-dicarboxylate transport protein
MRLFSKLHVQLLLGIVLGVAVGCLFPKQAAGLHWFGDLFIRLIRVLLPPIIFGTITVGIARMNDLKSVGRIGLKALVYFEIVSTLALVIGLVVVNVVKPGAGMNVVPGKEAGAAVAHSPTLLEFFTNLIPTSFAGPFVDGNILQVILLSILLGAALMRLGTRKEALVEVLDTFVHAMFGIVRMVMYLAPLAAFGAMASVIGKYGTRELIPYARLLACLYLTCLAVIFGVLGPVAWWCGISLRRFLGYILDEILVVAGTCSTEAVMPQMMAKLENLGCPDTLVGLVLPAGYTFNAAGTSVYITMAAIFIAQATNTPLTMSDQLILLGVSLLTSKGSAGVAGTGLVALAATLASTGKIPASGLALVLGVESLLNEARAITNVIGNGVATVAIARWEGVLDKEKARRVITPG